jgi:four helix bundle protein
MRLAWLDMAGRRGRRQVARMGFLHRRLTVYSRAVEWAVTAHLLTERVPFRWRSLVDQIHRAATSIVLNIAEGVAESSPREQSRFLRIARRSAAECDAAFHILHSAGPITDEEAAAVGITLNQISAMLTGLIRQSDARAATHTRRPPPFPPTPQPVPPPAGS